MFFVMFYGFPFYISFIKCVFSSTFVEMEKMIPSEYFSLCANADPSIVHSVIFAAKQNNLDYLEKTLIARSALGNSLYQDWLTFDEVNSITANPTAVSNITSWLKKSNASIDWQSKNSHYIRASASIGVWEKLFNTTFYKWNMKLGENKSVELIRSLDYSLPTKIVAYVAAVFNTCQSIPRMPQRVSRLSNDHAVFKTTFQASILDVAQNAVTVSFLDSYYAIPSSTKGSASLRQSVFETSSQSFSQADLLAFQQFFELEQQPALDIGGHESSSCNVDACSEGNLDIQYISGVAQSTTSIYWYVGGNDPFVDWIAAVADESSPPLSNSISYGSIEQETSPSVMNQFSVEAMKLAAMGVTISVSTGDDGVANFRCNCAADSSSSSSSWRGSNTWEGDGYFPSFPATCPYVVSVGATMGPNEGGDEVAAQSQLGGVITSGGGFSTFFPQPTWQSAAVDAYFAAPGLALPAPGYNAQGRAYPDISLIGVNYQVVIGGKFASLFGTSCSAPVFAAFISLVNAQRLALEQSSVGFINPTLYAFALTQGVFTDITSGVNKCCSSSNPSAATCCSSGFQSVSGWDPVSGLGGIKYPNLLSILNTQDQSSSIGGLVDPYTPAPSKSQNTTIKGHDSDAALVLAPAVVAGESDSGWGVLVVFIVVFVLLVFAGCVIRSAAKEQDDFEEMYYEAMSNDADERPIGAPTPAVAIFASHYPQRHGFESEDCVESGEDPVPVPVVLSNYPYTVEGEEQEGVRITFAKQVNHNRYGYQPPTYSPLQTENSGDAHTEGGA